jgi:hypothetical protein
MKPMPNFPHHEEPVRRTSAFGLPGQAAAFFFAADEFFLTTSAFFLRNPGRFP